MNIFSKNLALLSATAFITSLPMLAAANEGALHAPEDKKSLRSPPQIEPPHCFDFSTLPSQNVYEVGDEIQTELGTVKVRDYRVNGTWSQSEVETARIHNSAMAEGETPELRVQQANPVLILDEPAGLVKIKFAENVTGLGPHNNLVVNGRIREVDGSFASIDGLVMGNALTGRVRVNVTMTEQDSNTPETWPSGEIRLTSLNGKQIRRAGIGGLHLMMDDYCVYDNVIIAPDPIGNQVGN